MAIDHESEFEDEDGPDAEPRDEDYDRVLDRSAWAWAFNIARAYAATSRDPVSPAMEAWLARQLKAPVAECIDLCIHLHDWPSDYVNPHIEEWEDMALRKPGPRLTCFDYGSRVVVMD